MDDKPAGITIRELTLQDSVALAHTLSTDVGLSKRLGNAQIAHISAGHFFNRTRESCRVRNAVPYVIVAADRGVIGLITLGHADEINKTARIAFWIESKSWGQGFCTEVLSPVLDLAKGKGVERIVGQIDKDDLAGREIWERNGAQVTGETEASYTYEIRL